MESAVSKTAPVVPVVLDRERHLKFDLNSIALIEEATGFNLLDGSQDKIFNARYLRLMVWAGLLHEDPKIKFDVFGKIVEAPELSIAQVGKLLSIANAADVLAKVAQAWQLSRPESKEEADPTPPSTVLQ